jgi:hypothetical protein
LAGACRRPYLPGGFRLVDATLDLVARQFIGTPSSGSSGDSHSSGSGGSGGSTLVGRLGVAFPDHSIPVVAKVFGPVVT